MYVLFSKYMGGNPVYQYKVGLDRVRYDSVVVVCKVK